MFRPVLLVLAIASTASALRATRTPASSRLFGLRAPVVLRAVSDPAGTWNQVPSEESKSANLAGLNSWDPTTWVAPSIWNKNLFRAAAFALSIFAVANVGGVSDKLAPFLAFLHVAGHSFWFGSMLYTTFIAGLTMFKNLPRQTFGRLQSKLFPRYFGVGALCVVVELLTAKALGLTPATLKTVYTTLGIGLAAGLLNLWFLEPKATEVMMKRYAMENQNEQSDPRYKKLAAAFGKWHGLSSLVNLIALCAAISYSWMLGGFIMA